jgi:oxygen-dependent protoporphyrinogen oxidase
MAEVVEALVAPLASPPRLRTAQGITGIAPATHGWRLSLTGGSSLEAEAVILAVSAWVAARLLAALGVSAARALDEVIYYPSVTVSLAYRADQLRQMPEGTGFVSAPDAGGVVRACTYAWRKYPKRAPDGHALLRAFLGPADGDPGAIAHAELAPILGLVGAPLWTRAFHWPRSLPRYQRGHAERVAAVRERLARLAPLAIAGAGFDGAGVSACVRSGREAAKLVLRRLAD